MFAQGIRSLYFRLARSPTLKLLTKTGELIAKLTVFFAIIAWFVEIPDRVKQKHYAAWQVINSAYGKHGDSGRAQALQDLNDDGVALESIDLTNASLLGANLRGVDFRNAILVNTDMSGADFSCRESFAKILTHYYQRCSNFDSVLFDHTLTNTNFHGAYLHDITIDYKVESVSFSYTHMQKIKLTDNSLELPNITFEKNDFSHSIIVDSDFKGATFVANIFSGAIIYNVDFSNTRVEENDLAGALLCQITLSSGKPFGEQCPEVQRITGGTWPLFHGFLDRIPN